MLLVIQRLQLCFWAFWSLATNLMLLARKFLHEACQSFIWKLLFPVEIVPSRRRRVIKYMRVYTFSHAYLSTIEFIKLLPQPSYFLPTYTNSIYTKGIVVCSSEYLFSECGSQLLVNNTDFNLSSLLCVVYICPNFKQPCVHTYLYLYVYIGIFGCTCGIIQRLIISSCSVPRNSLNAQLNIHIWSK